MSVAVSTGKCAAPGDVLYTVELSDGECGAASTGTQAVDTVVAGNGCYARAVIKSDGTLSSQIISTLLGVVQWSGNTVSVRRPIKRPRGSVTPMDRLFSDDVSTVTSAGDAASAPVTGGEGSTATATAAATSPSLWISTTVFGPRMGDNVHVRVVRVSRSFAYGEIIAVNGTWCSNSNSGSVGTSSGFRGIIRMEDIRPFKPQRDQLTPPPPAAAFQDGDVVVATVLSQSDVRQYQLSTVAEHCGVVEAVVTLRENDRKCQVQLKHIPGRRDAMMCPLSGNVHYRWCPLIRAV